MCEEVRNRSEEGGTKGVTVSEDEQEGVRVSGRGNDMRKEIR